MRTMPGPILALLAVLCGCSRLPVPMADAAAGSATPTPQISDAIQVDAKGKPDFALVPPGQATVGLRVFQADVEDGQLKLVEGGSDVVVRVKRKKNGLEVQDATGKRVLTMTAQADHYRFLDGTDTLVYEARTSGAPMRLTNDLGAVGMLSAQNGGWEWTDKSKKLQARVVNSTQSEVGLVLPLARLKPEQRAAVALYLLTFKP